MFLKNVSIKPGMLKINDPSPLAVFFSNFNMKMNNKHNAHPIAKRFKKPLQKYSTNKNITATMGTTIAMNRKSCFFL